MCEALGQLLHNWNPLEGRLRCFSYIVNLAVYTFFYAANANAVDYAIKQALGDYNTQQSVDNQLLALSEKELSGWIYIAPIQKILAFVKTFRRSDRLYKALKTSASKVIRAPNDTR